MESVLIEQLRCIALMTGGEQHKYFSRRLQDAKVVQLESVDSVLDKHVTKKLKERLDVEQKQCYKNASLVSYILSSLGYDCRYVEGEMTVFRAVPLQHAWNCIVTEDGEEHHFDVTVEWALDRTPMNEEYMMVGCYKPNEVRKATIDTGVYGEIYSYYYKQNLKKLKDNGTNH